MKVIKTHQIETSWLPSKPPEKALKHTLLKVLVALAISFMVFFFLGMVSFIPNDGLYFRAPNFPLQYTNWTPCLLCVQSYSLGFAAIDFLIWYVLASLGIFTIIALLTANSAIRLRHKFALTKKTAHILGFMFVAAILFAIFIPVIPTPDGQFTGCSGFGSNQKCINETQVGSITYALFCQGVIWDYPTTAYTLTVCMYG